jgi:hypothetical protein
MITYPLEPLTLIISSREFCAGLARPIGTIKIIKRRDQESATCLAQAATSGVGFLMPGVKIICLATAWEAAIQTVKVYSMVMRLRETNDRTVVCIPQIITLIYK